MTARIMMGAAALALLAGCTTYDPYTGAQVRDNTRTGALGGAAGGAVLGAIIAGDGRDKEGALIGGALGALAAGAVGNYMDRQQQALRAELANTGVDVQRQGDNIVLNMPGDITFGFDSANLDPQFIPVLDDVARTLAQFNQTTVSVVGHTDGIGADAYNQRLSEQRANSVAGALTQRGVAPNRIYVAGRGKTQPIATNDTDEGRARNRRVEIVLTPIVS